MRIRKSRCIESDKTHYFTERFNMVLSLYRVLGITLYFSKNFSEATVKGLAVAEALQSLEVTIVCFLGQESNLWSSVPQQRHRLFSRCFLYLLLVNLLLLASLEERFTHGELDCFLKVGNGNDLDRDDLVDKVTGDRFVLF